MVYTHIPGRVCAHWSVANRVLGELQLAFVLFAVGHAFDAFDAWKNLVILFTSCDAALRTHPALFSAFAGTSSSVLAPAPSGCSQRRATALAPHRHLPEPTDASAWRALPGHACQGQCRSWDHTGTVAPQRLQPAVARGSAHRFFFLFLVARRFGAACASRACPRPWWRPRPPSLRPWRPSFRSPSARHALAALATKPAVTIRKTTRTRTTRPWWSSCSVKNRMWCMVSSTL